MIEKLDETYDEEIFSSISRHCSTGTYSNASRFVLSSPLIELAEEFVFYCCGVLSEAKSARITANFEGDSFDPATFAVCAYFSIGRGESGDAARKGEIARRGDRLIKFEMPRSSRDFNGDPAGFYKKLMAEIYGKYKAIAKAK